MKISNVRKLTDQKWLNLFGATYDHNGHEGHWVFASRRDPPDPAARHCDAVVMVPILREPGQPPRLVMIKEFRVPVGDYLYELPAGLVEKGEAIEETVRRELLEETGFEVTAVKRVTPPLYSSAGLTDETVALAFVDVRSTPGAHQALEGSEDIEVLLLDFAQITALCNDPDKRFDAKAWAVLYLYLQLGQLTRGAAVTGLLLSDDLLFTSRIVGEARALGLTVKAARSADVLLALARQEAPACVLIDLANPGLALPDLLRQLADLGQPRVVAYGSHVDTATLRAAREAGCDPVLPRSKFVEDLVAELPGWFQRA